MNGVTPPNGSSTNQSMASYQEIADHLHLSKTRVSDLVKEGMPTTTVKAAKNWRDRQEQKREPTGGKTANLQSKSSKKGRPRTPPKPSQTGDSLLDALRNAIAISDWAFRAYVEADDRSKSARLSEHNKALATRLSAEKAYREEQERREILVMKTEITDRCRRGMEAVLRRLNKMPMETGPQANPGDPLMARSVIQKAVDEIKRAAQNAMADMDAKVTTSDEEET